MCQIAVAVVRATNPGSSCLSGVYSVAAVGLDRDQTTPVTECDLIVIIRLTSGISF